MSTRAPEQRVGFAALPDMADLIRRRSVNREDIREVFLRNLDLTGAQSMLDLGCGIGFLTDQIARQLSPGSTITGIDRFSGHRAAYLLQMRDAGHQARFLHREIERELPCPDDAYDLVVCSFSLYFFADAVGEVARVLKPKGLLLASTHSASAFEELLAAAGVGDQPTPLRETLARFTAQNGARLLAPYFGSLERVDYPNRLAFGPEALEDLVRYVEYKLPYLLPGRAALPPETRTTLETCLREQGTLLIDKSDCCFYCRHPRSRPRASRGEDALPCR